MLIVLLGLIGCSSTATSTPTSSTNESVPPTVVITGLDDSVEETAVSSHTLTIQGEVWADNWFAFYLGESLVMEDSVPITTERSLWNPTSSQRALNGQALIRR